MRNPDARFVLETAKGRIAFNSLGQVATALKLSDTQALALKAKVFVLVKEIAEQAERRYPDATTGLTAFLNGQDYRTPFHDGFYNYTAIVEISDTVDAYLDRYGSPDLRHHEFHASDVPWPFRWHIVKKSHSVTGESRYLMDPLQLIAFLQALARDKKFSATLNKQGGRTEAITFISSHRYNKLTILDPMGIIHLNHQVFSHHMVEVLSRFLVEAGCLPRRTTSTARGRWLACLRDEIKTLSQRDRALVNLLQEAGFDDALDGTT